MNTKINQVPNNKFAEILYVSSKKVSCDGGGVEKGHPKVYLNMGEKDFVVCNYCGKVFKIKK